MRRVQQLQVEGRAYLAEARELLRLSARHGYPHHALQDIAAAREALHEAAMRFAEMKKIEDESEEIPF